MVLRRRASARAATAPEPPTAEISEARPSRIAHTTGLGAIRLGRHDARGVLAATAQTTRVVARTHLASMALPPSPTHQSYESRARWCVPSQPVPLNATTHILVRADQSQVHPVVRCQYQTGLTPGVVPMDPSWPTLPAATKYTSNQVATPSRVRSSASSKRGGTGPRPHSGCTVNTPLPSNDTSRVGWVPEPLESTWLPSSM